MKTIIITTFTLLVIGMFLTIHPAFAKDRVKVYEMAESGIVIEFKMTPEEIAAKDAENATQDALKEAAKNNARQRLKVYEMAESGQTFSFPMTSEEIAIENAENSKLAAILKAKPEEQQKQVVIFELAESGISIEFPVETPIDAVAEAITERKILDDLKI